ncbi:MAG: MAPEG family protein [Rhodospirillales bacterium]|nr:MAPEG family protein [Rhodospirillales bacterium]
MTTELSMLVWTTGLTGVLWLGYMMAQSRVSGLVGALSYGYKEPLAPLPAWAERLKAHHHNSVENLVLFAALVIVAHLTQSANGATAAAAITFFWARVAHLVLHVAGVPYLRSGAFVVGWLALVCIFYQIVT